MAIFPFRFTVWISVLYERSFQILLLKNFKDLHMFFKELACLYCLVINVHFSWNALRSNTFAYHSFATALSCYHVLLSLSTTFFNFFQLVFALSKKVLKTCCFSVVCCCRVQQPWLIYTPVRQKSTTFLKILPKRHFD